MCRKPHGFLPTCDLVVVVVVVVVIVDDCTGTFVVDLKRIDLLSKCVRKASEMRSAKGYPLQGHFETITPLIRPPS